jgi:hypothetical protein
MTPLELAALDALPDGSLTQEEVRELTAAIVERDASFDLRWKADMRAIKMWQEAHPERGEIWPDHADMVVWLLEALTEARALLDDALARETRLREDRDKAALARVYIEDNLAVWSSDEATNMISAAVCDVYRKILSVWDTGRPI